MFNILSYKLLFNKIMIITIGIICLLFVLKYLKNKLSEFKKEFIEKTTVKFTDVRELLSSNENRLKQLAEVQLSNQQLINNSIQSTMLDVRNQSDPSFKCHINSLSTHLTQLTNVTQTQLKNITEQMNNRLGEGFNKNSVVFTNLIKRLALIDEAQKKISTLSHQMVDLQSIFQDKQSRGIMGEVQLENLIANVIPKSNYRTQYVLKNQRRADCVLLLPEPTGMMVIDAKFPLESYQSLIKENGLSHQRHTRTKFKQDIKKHIDDIAMRYISAEETAESAIMFIPAEAIFAEIHATFADLVSYSYSKKVWIASPTTLMAILTTAQAVIKDDATKHQVDIVQQHLMMLAKDFHRFEKRMENLSRHMQKASHDVDEINTSAKKISDRFSKIEQLDLNLDKNEALTKNEMVTSPEPEDEV